jgi:hypothetical protein
MACNALAVAKPGEYAQRAGQVLLLVLTLR